jgi:hypothetical protein
MAALKRSYCHVIGPRSGVEALLRHLKTCINIHALSLRRCLDKPANGNLLVCCSQPLTDIVIDL